MLKTCARPECGRTFSTQRRSRVYCSRDCSNRDYQRKLESEYSWQVLSCGGGVQSTGMIAAIVLGYLPRPDLVVFVDTGYEKRTTLDYMEAVLKPACEGMGLEMATLKPQCEIFNNQGMLSLPAYRDLGDGQVQKMYTLCNGPWKQTPIRQFLRGRGMKRATSWIGISSDEARRVRRSPQQWLGNRYPLLELGWSRYKCLYAAREAGWPDPPRTSCLMCPGQPDEEWELMWSESPEDYARCEELDARIEAWDASVYLHRSMMRLRDITWRGQVEQRGRAGQFSTVY